jgi:heterodisulfide reductase subunit A
VGYFKVEIAKKPQYIDETKCTSCGECSTVCPVSVTKDYEMGLGERKAVYIPHPQSYPKRYIIDEKNCLHFKDNSCSACLSACPENAVNFDRELKDEEIEVDAIIVATGSNLFKNEKKAEYGYGPFKNVITGIEFERLYDPVGPTEGKIVRISDGEKPKTAAFILCVGFRDEKNNKYCCRTGCMSALKHAYLLKNQYGDEVEAYILYTDIRAAGLGYEEFYRKARETGLILIKGKPSEVRLLPDNSCSIEVFEANTHKLISITSDLVVLEGGATPNNNLREILNIPLRQDGFYAESHPQLSPTETRIKGVFLAGTAHGPKDIPETITHASSAAMKVLTYLREISSKTEI